MPSMTRAERLSSMLEMLVSDGRIDVEHSASHFGVSAATIRRDLDYLADQQLLSRTHGGAVPNTHQLRPAAALQVERPRARPTPDRRARGRHALARLHPGPERRHDDGRGRPRHPGAQALHNGVTVVTNAINIATELTVRPFIKIVVCGGVARPQSYELVGALATETLGQLTPDICFLGAIGVDPARASPPTTRPRRRSTG